ncbi:tail fiber protein [Muribacter muris]|uniref:tail fiber protein n=1 Tax=Muribacter muris TaxID=67855 RepID=UPI001D16DD3D|nr:tail fiber protein [Muribacter muris]
MTAKAGKHISQQVAQLQQNIANNYIQNSKKSSAINSSSGDTVATSAAVKTAYDKATNAENNANGRVSKAGDTMTGGLSINHATGAGGLAGQYTTNAPFFADVGNAQGRNNYYPYIKGRVSNGDGWGTALSFGYVTPTNRNQFGQGVIHLIEDNGISKEWTFEHSGELRSPGDVITGQGRSLNQMKEVAVLAGEVNHDGWIPLPDGFSEA